MKPHETSEFLIQFGAPWSAWWLAVCLPVALFVGWWLYRRQFKGIARLHVVGLLALRLGLLAALVFILFRPSLISRKILTYPGRVVLALDNSASMTAKDTGYTDEEALVLARRLGLMPIGPEAALHQQATIVAGINEQVQAFGEFSRAADRGRDSFWNAASQVRAQLHELFEQLQPPLPELRALAESFFTGPQDPGRKAYEDFADRAGAAARQLLEQQAAADKQAIAAGNTGLRDAANAVRARTRLELLEEKLRQTPVSISNQFVQVERWTGPTDLVGRLTGLVEADEPFPLSGIVLLSEGRDLGGHSVADFARQANRREVTINTAGIGSPREPVDLAILRVSAPPFAVKGRPVRVKVLLKTSLPAPAEVTLTVSQGSTTVAEQRLTLGAEPTQPVTVEFSPTEIGLTRYTVRLESVAGEVFPVQNNAGDFVVDVRDRKIWVLFADWKPRWETRFALNILQRLDYVELNSVIGIVQEDAQLPRGAQKGMWPDSVEALQAYDLIVLGDLPVGTLTAADREALRTVVERDGKTICHLGTRRGVAAVDRAAAGEFHPLTRRLAVPVAASTNDTVLLQERGTGAALITAAFTGAGKTARIETDELWRLLNPTQLDAHTELYVGLVSWAMQGANGGADLRAYTTTEPVQVWRTNAVPARIVYTNTPPAEVGVMLVADDPELKFLARDDAFLTQLATATGGAAVDFSDFESSLRQIKPKERVERLEKIWQLWSSAAVLVWLALTLTVEWIWRKWVGLV